MADIHAKARALGERALDVLEEIMDSHEEAKDRIRAAEAILDRGYGKAAQAVIAIPAQRRAALAAASMSDDELRRVIDAEFEEVRPTAALPAPKDPLLE